MKIPIAALAVLLAVVGCRTEPALKPENNATVMLTAEAGVFMAVLKEQGGVPGIAPSQHGNLEGGIVGDPNPQPAFPFEARVGAVMADNPGTTYGFVVTKETEASPWTITKAWKRAGGVTTDLQIPSAAVQSAANAELSRRKERQGIANQPSEGIRR